MWLWSRTGAGLLRLSEWLETAASACLRVSERWLEERAPRAAALSLLAYAALAAGPVALVVLIVLGAWHLAGGGR